MNACWCSECGEGAHFDEDGLCVSCGTSMIAPDVFEAICKAERNRCMHAAEAICVAMANSERVEMGRARSEGRQEAEGFFGHGAFVADELNQAIYNAINADSQEDPIEAMRERCAALCDAIAEEYSRLASVPFQRGDITKDCVGYAVARECARRIRGEK